MEPIVITWPAGSQAASGAGSALPGASPRDSSAKVSSMTRRVPTAAAAVASSARSGALIRCPAGLWKSGMR